jgi:spermidine synthase
MNEKRLIILSIIGTGITSVATQLVTIREFLTQFHGNEITISLVLFCWLFLTGIGSFAAKGVKRTNLKVYSLLILVIAVWPLLQLIAIRGLRETFFTHGVSPGFYPIFFYILASITPYCLLTGFILPHALKVLTERQHGFESGDLYLTDSIGDIIGGALFSFVLVYWLNPFSTIAITSSLLILVAFVLLIKTRGYILLLVAVGITSMFYGYAANGCFERLTLAGQYGNIEQYLESPYGRIVITGEASQRTFWESGSPLYSGSNLIASEEKVHYGLCQLERVENVLLVSGGLGETIAEINKYSPAHIDYVELDPMLTETAVSLGVLKQAPFLEIMNTDGRSHIKKTKRKYDAIIIDLPDPDTFQINRFFTSEFFSLTKKILKDGGVLSISMEYSPNYISDIRREKFSTIYNTARRHFRNVLVLPGEDAYFLCRDGNLWGDIPARLMEKSISTAYIDGYFYGNVTEERIKQLEASLDKTVPINTDFNPNLISIVFRQWFIKHGTSPHYVLFAFLGLVVIYLIFIRKQEYVLFSTGLAAMGVEMLVIFAFQVVYGYIYLKIGAIVTAFLMGLLPGALLGNFRKHRRGTFDLKVSEVLLLLLLALFYFWAVCLRNELHALYYMIYCFLFSFVCGFQFPIVAGMIGEKESPAAGCLAADLAGAAVGTLVTGTILIPLWGIQTAVIFLIVVKVSSLVTVFLFQKKE